MRRRKERWKWYCQFSQRPVPSQMRRSFQLLCPHQTTTANIRRYLHLHSCWRRSRTPSINSRTSSNARDPHGWLSPLTRLSCNRLRWYDIPLPPAPTPRRGQKDGTLSPPRAWSFSLLTHTQLLGGLVGGSQHKGRLFPHRYSASPSKVAPLHTGAQPLPISGPAFRHSNDSKFFAVIATQMCSLGHSSFLYLDKWLLAALLHPCLLSAIFPLHPSLGVCFNKEKSVLIPTQMINFTGAWLDSIAAWVFLPADHFITIMNQTAGLCCNPHITIHCCLPLLGHLTVCTSVMPHARLHVLPSAWLLSV
ncbi:uncharacterized protein LOC115659884 [Gopherus evgoodei]|uniref:uncharacterized protein LOC115659884 n=1 Tax=Gopherus evgoodei TaxID=1825980 RepID=UPI0011D0008F|nr:uncharacterized protein LOC115659884 [Gopherus evgoodei]